MDLWEYIQTKNAARPDKADNEHRRREADRAALKERGQAWELVCGDSGPSTFTHRLRVPGGWIYCVTTFVGTTTALIHVPDVRR